MMLLRLSLFLSVVIAGCGGGLPQADSDDYREVVSAFYAGVAAMEVGEDLRAEAKLRRVTEIAPEEPAAWANLALLALRRSEYEQAGELLATARALEPQGSHVLHLSGLLELFSGRGAEALGYLRSAVTADSTNLRAAYALLSELEEDDAEAQALWDFLAASAPDNLVVLLERTRRAGGVTPEALSARASSWGPEAVAQLAAVEEAIGKGDASTQLAFLRNVLLSEPTFRQDLGRLRTPAELVAKPMVRFRRLEVPRPSPAPPDDSLDFALKRLLPEEAGRQEWISAVALGNEGLPAIFFADDTHLRTLRGESWPFPGDPGRHAAAAFDYDYDFRTDLALAGDGGLRLLRQDSTEAFTNVTSALGLSRAITEDTYTGVWAADLDLEGDVDLVLATRAGPVRTLRNNGDGAFSEVALFEGISGLRNFAWADLDRDGDPDAVFLDETGAIHLWGNERQGRFVAWAAPSEASPARDIAVTDSNSDSMIDLLVLRADGVILRLSAPGWEAEQIADYGGPLEEGARLLPADLDNNGGLDLLLATSAGAHAWLQDENYAFERLDAGIEAEVFALAAVRQAGQLDLIGLDAAGQPVRVAVLSTKGYHWKQIRPRAARAVGDQRINSFGIGGEVELRSGLLYQKQPITQPILHFGLGEYLLADVARITWPNGSVQAEFDMLSDQIVSAQQRLKGSCPWLFTFDGERVQFVTDFIWRSPLGLRINAQETAGVMTTEDWVKIRGDQLRARDGSYDVRITAELWETHFFDHVALLVVDHPRETEIFVDERFAIPPPELDVRVTENPQPVAQAWDDSGRDVTPRIRARDGRYLDFFGRGSYQGVTRDHFVEIDPGDAVPEASWLIASGWIRPTDSSINVAISQGRQDRPRGLRLEAQDADGAWRVVRDNLGFPSGKAKTILIDLEGAFAEGAPRRLRLSTNLEIYWDEISWAAKAPGALALAERLDAETADLQYRGYSVVTEADRSSPELPDYNTLAGTVPVWRDLIGYYTRFGDVRPLLRGVDDRYVIMNAGDELALQFAAPPAPPEGWKRDFVLIGDGWVKDGDYNTTSSKTVRPLPAHDLPTYTRLPGALEHDPIYRRHADDWRWIHTRYVTPDHFSDGIRLR